MRLRVLLLLVTTVASGPVWADAGIQAGPRGGVVVGDGVDASAGLDVRLLFPLSPLAVNPTFDYLFAEKKTLYQIGANALWSLPLPSGVIAPYLGIGVNVTSFSLRTQTPDVDNEGYRIGMNLIAGASVTVPVVSPYVQVTKGIGEFDLLTVGGGLAFTVRNRGGDIVPSRPGLGLVATAYIDNNVAGDVQSGRGGLGLTVGYYLRGRIGFELDGELHPHFFRDEDVGGLVPPGVDLNTSATQLSGNLVAPYCLASSSIGTWCPYVTTGAGIIRAVFEGIALMPGGDRFDELQTNLALNAGVGLMHALTRHLGFRVDARYLHAFVDEDERAGGYFEDYGFWRVSVGLMFGFLADGSSPQ